ncbi:unnamed protein product [Lactuca saligna]|uniref:ACB domain-containing protein n=1 Tax=Lactuca saligna TaxID=75948 RepID=A0AA35YXM9_LACSI|nr:unnamed protein product [Lactuca saligna]
METLHQIFLTVIAAFVFFVLIAKIASSATNGDEYDHRRSRIRDFSKVLAEELNPKMEKSISKRKSLKKVRFAVDHEGTLVNKVVAGPSETKQVVFESQHDADMIRFNDVGSVVKSLEEEIGGVEKAEFADFKPMAESVSPRVIEHDETKEGNTDSIDQKSSQATMIPDENADIGAKLLCDDGMEKNDDESFSAVESVVKSPEEEFGGVEKADYDDYKPNAESVIHSVVDDDQTKEGNTELIDQKLKGENEGLISEEDDSDSDDDWEGIEKSDLEKVFAMAADYGKQDDHLQSLGSDIQMQLYGLHKVATEGPCHEAQPIALKLSARSKWNAWQKLGNMDPDVAMEQYITLLSEKVPEWSQGIHSLGADLSSSSTTSTLVTSQK